MDAAKSFTFPVWVPVKTLNMKPLGLIRCQVRVEWKTSKLYKEDVVAAALVWDVVSLLKADEATTVLQLEACNDSLLASNAGWGVQRRLGAHLPSRGTAHVSVHPTRTHGYNDNLVLLQTATRKEPA